MFWQKRSLFATGSSKQTVNLKLDVPKNVSAMVASGIIRVPSTLNNHVLMVGCFNWMMKTNLSMGNGCFTKHPFVSFKTCCLEVQVDH